MTIQENTLEEVKHQLSELKDENTWIIDRVYLLNEKMNQAVNSISNPLRDPDCLEILLRMSRETSKHLEVLFDHYCEDDE